MFGRGIFPSSFASYQKKSFKGKCFQFYRLSSGKPIIMAKLVTWAEWCNLIGYSSYSFYSMYDELI